MEIKKKVYVVGCTVTLRASALINDTARSLAIAVSIFLLPALVAAAPKAPQFDWPPGFNFASAIESEGYSLDDFYQTYEEDLGNDSDKSSYGLALANLTLGIEQKDASLLARAKKFFLESYSSSRDDSQKTMAKIGIAYIDDIFNDRFAIGSVGDDRVVPVTIKKTAPPKPGFKHIILGLSAIHVSKETKIKTQVDRVTRDWLQGFNIKSAPWSLNVDQVTTWHEGLKIREIVALSGARISAVTGTVVRRFGNDWFAQDGQGHFRFKISEDKVLNVPTNFVVDDRTVILNDTHGISALAWDALDANLVIGCGDAVGKMEAAYYLSEKGVDVYAPTDRLIGMLVGSEGKGIVIGSAPVKKSAEGAVIGDQPITFDVDEPIVVSNTRGHYPLQYYDTPYRYFKALESYIQEPLKIFPVEVKQYGHAEVVVDEARKMGANLIGIRVWSKEEHDVVAAWLSESAKHRAVLFHSAVYPQGYRLFFEFPKQTSFGDIHPKFVS